MIRMIRRKNICVFYFFFGTCKFSSTKCNYSPSKVALPPTGWRTDHIKKKKKALDMTRLGEIRNQKTKQVKLRSFMSFEIGYARNNRRSSPTRGRKQNSEGEASVRNKGRYPRTQGIRRTRRTRSTVANCGLKTIDQAPFQEALGRRCRSKSSVYNF